MKFIFSTITALLLCLVPAFADGFVGGAGVTQGGAFNNGTINGGVFTGTNDFTKATVSGVLTNVPSNVTYYLDILGNDSTAIVGSPQFQFSTWTNLITRIKSDGYNTNGIVGVRIGVGSFNTGTGICASNVVFYGAGTYATLLSCDPTLSSSALNAAIHVQNNDTFINLSILAQTTNVLSTAPGAIQDSSSTLDGTANAYFYNCYIAGWYDGIYLRNVNVCNLTFYNCIGRFCYDACYFSGVNNSGSSVTLYNCDWTLATNNLPVGFIGIPGIIGDYPTNFYQTRMFRVGSSVTGVSIKIYGGSYTVTNSYYFGAPAIDCALFKDAANVNENVLLSGPVLGANTQGTNSAIFVDTSTNFSGTYLSNSGPRVIPWIVGGNAPGNLMPSQNGVITTVTNLITFSSVSLVTNTLGYDGTAFVSAGTTVILNTPSGVAVGTVGTVGSVYEVIPMRAGWYLSGTSMSGSIY